jgi:hypothetical protein
MSSSVRGEEPPCIKLKEKQITVLWKNKENEEKY